MHLNSEGFCMHLMSEFNSSPIPNSYSWEVLITLTACYVVTTLLGAMRVIATKQKKMCFKTFIISMEKHTAF